MSKMTKDILKVVLADKPEVAVKEILELDKSKRGYMLGLGSLIAGLSACSAPVDPNLKTNTPERAVRFERRKIIDDKGNIVIVSCDDDLCIEDDDEDPVTGSPIGAPPTGTAPFTPPVTPPVTPPATPVTPVDPTPVTPPVDTTPVTPPVDTTNPIPNPVPTTPITPAQTFTALGPGLIGLHASDMMNFSNVQVMSDGTPLIVWGFTNSGMAAFNGDLNRLCPGPVIEAIEGELTTIALTSAHPHTLHLHGLDVDQANDGVPATSGYVSQFNPNTDFIPPNMQLMFDRLAPSALPLGNPFEYKFTAPHAGTYMYHCHVDTVLHMEMGMSGVIIVRPPDGNKNVLYANGPIYDREYIWQLHTFDSTWHEGSAISGGTTMRHSPDYFMINGRDGADILTDTTAAIEGAASQQVVIRLVNLGYQPAVVNLGGIPFDVIASDGRPLKKLFLELFTEMIVAPGERYDIMFTMPVAGVTSTKVDYLDITGRNILGTAVSSITSL